MLRRLAAFLVALILATPVSAFPIPQGVELNGGVGQSWMLPSPGIDFNFARSGNSCAVLKVPKSCQSFVINSRASVEECVWLDGHWSEAASAIPCFSDVGLWSWQTTTNLALWARDLTQSGTWIISNSTDITATKNAVGIDKAANAATTLTANATNGTILQTITAVSSANIYSVFVKCVTCTGNVQITQNNGTVWNTLTSANCVDPVTLAATAPTTTKFVRCSVEATLANPVIGFRFANIGDSVVVDANQDEALAFVTPPVYTTSAIATRVADNNIVVSQIFGQAFTTYPTTLFSQGITTNTLTTRQMVDINDGTANNRGGIRVGSNDKPALATTSGGSIIANFSTSATQTNGTTFKEAGVIASADYTVVFNAGTVATAATAGAFPVGVTQVMIGRDSSAGGNFFDGVIQRIALWPGQRKSNVFLQNITQ